MPESNIWIPMPDGVRLAATLYLPEGDAPQPAILEALPYRKDDVTAYDTPEYRRLRDEGDYAVCRVDLRGTGSSEGIAADEYPAQEQRDMCDVIAWLAEREWCTGNVGMYGASYSGFNSLQVAMERPPALKAIIPMYATDDRYTDDVHYFGGVRRALDLVDYPLYMVAMNALPPVPAIAGESWRALWERRVEELEPWLLRWLEEPLDGPYWRHGSLRPHYERIRCATMIIGGWADGYRNATLRVFERLRCPKKLLLGPWAHTSTETSIPGPRADVVPEMIRWWDRWLRDDRNGVDEEPGITVFVRRSTPPASDTDSMRGEFRHEPVWPPERGFEQGLALADAHVSRPSNRGRDDLVVRGDVGATASMWCAGAQPFGLPFDQRADEAFSLTYDWGPLPEQLEVLGYPCVELAVASSAPVASVSVKLCDVFQDGSSALVSRGVLNLTHRDSHAEPQRLEPGRLYTVTIELDATSWVFEPGHRLRLDVAGTDWPNLWPPPEAMTLSVERSSSRLVLPRVTGAVAEARPASLHPARPRPARAPHRDDPPAVWRIETDVVNKERRVTIDHGGDTDLDIGGHLTEHYFGVAGVSPDDPGNAYVLGRSSFALRWPDVEVRTESRVTLRSDAHSFYLTLDLDVQEDDVLRWSRRWERSYARDFA
ncbi:MAG: CocE/NonD family hydrolase [Actinomycetota bacterium]